MIKKALFDIASFIKIDEVLYAVKKKKKLATILSLHRISDEPDFFWEPVRINTFKKILEYCSSRYEIVHLSKLGEAITNKPLLSISFDDGYSDFVENALPELNRYGLPSNHNVVINCVEKGDVIWSQELNHIFSFLREKEISGPLPFDPLHVELSGNHSNWMKIHSQVYRALLRVSKTEKAKVFDQWKNTFGITPAKASMMNWDQVKSCLRHDVEIGSHTMSHATLSVAKDYNSLNFELEESKRILEEKLLCQCDTIALPNGQYNETVLKAIQKAGYKRALLANDELAKPQELQGSFSVIPRMNVVEETFKEVKLRIEGFHHFVKNGRL